MNTIDFDAWADKIVGREDLVSELSKAYKLGRDDERAFGWVEELDDYYSHEEHD